MENSQLIFILRTFDKKEIRDFRKWIQSPAHNQREDVSDLYEYLITGDRLLNESLLEKEKVFKKIYPKTDFDDAKLRQTIFFLLKTVEEYLIYQEMKSDEVGERLALARVYRKRNLDKPFRRNIRLAAESQEHFPYRNTLYLNNDYRLQLEEFHFREKVQRTAEMHLQEVSDSLEVHFLAEKLRLSSVMRSHQRVFKVTYQTGLLDKALSHIEEKNLLHIPAIAVYYYIYKASSNPEDETFFHLLKKEIRENGSLFPDSELRDILLHALNYCIGKINSGVDSYLKESLDLYKNGLETKVLIENGTLTMFTFLNIIRIALKLDQFEWTKNFIDHYQSYLDSKNRKHIVDYSMAKWHFEQGTYDKAMSLLIYADFDDILLHLSAKSMLLKIYYEKEEEDALDSLLESMRIYIHRKQVMGYHQSNYLNLIKLTKKLLHINTFDKNQTEKLKKEIEATTPLTEKEWLLSQLKQ
jgi:hypothetical protein